MQRFVNNWAATLVQGLAASADSLELTADAAAALGVLAPGDFYLLTLAATDDQGKESVWEIVRATGVSGNAVAIERGQEGTAAIVWASGADISMRLTAGAAQALGEHAAAADPHPQYAKAATAPKVGDVLFTLRDPGSGYAPAGSIQMQADYPELFSLVGLIDGTPPTTATWGKKVIDTEERDHYWIASDGWAVFIVGAGPGRLLRTDDSGETWTVVTLETYSHLYCFDTNGMGTWVASEQGTNFIWRSTDEGLTWSKVTTPAVRALCLAMAPNGVCLAGGQSGNMLRSTDGGATWATVTTGFGTTTIDGIATDGAGNWVLVGRFGKTSYSTDDGATFTLTAGSPFGTTNMDKIATNKAGIWVVASGNGSKLGVSTDNGATWTLKPGIEAVQCLAHVEDDEWVAFTYGAYHVWRTFNNWLSWTEGSVNTGPVSRIAKGKSSDGRIYAAHSYGKFILEPIGSFPYDPDTQFKVPAVTPIGVTAYVKATA